MTRKVLLADDHALVRRGLRALIDSYDGFEVVGEASDGREALALCRQLEPDLAVMDLSMPGLNGLDAMRRIVKAVPTCNVVMLSMHAAEHYVIEALRAGACAYVIKDAAPEALEVALVRAGKGLRYLSPPLPASLLEQAARMDNASIDPAGSYLTSRQREILQLIAEGHSTREIADRLHISIKTVETHRAQLMQRLGIHDVAGLTRHAIRCGLISPDT